MVKPWTDKAQLNSEFMPGCMGVPAVKNIGIQSNAPQEKQDEAKDACRRDYCEWICRVSVETVHEPQHDWYDNEVKLNATLLLLNAAVGRSGIMVMRNFILREIAGHMAEAQFLKETIEEMERKGQCNDVRRTISDKEREDLWRWSLRRAQKYVEDLP